VGKACDPAVAARTLLLKGWLFVAAVLFLPLPALAGATNSSATANSAATASNAAPLSSTEWRIECGNNGKALNCQIINHIFQQNGAEVASIAVRPAAAGPVFAVVQLPLGIALNAPVQLSVQGALPLSLTVNTCIQQGCIATAALSPNFVLALVASAKLTLSFGMANSRTVTMGVPLTGFGLAYHYVTRP
jgi:invasion protein IalB